MKIHGVGINIIQLGMTYNLGMIFHIKIILFCGLYLKDALRIIYSHFDTLYGCNS